MDRPSIPLPASGGDVPPHPSSSERRLLDRLYRLAVITLAAFVVFTAALFIARAAIYKIHPYERGLHLRGGRFVRVDEPGWHIRIPLGGSSTCALTTTS